MAVSRAAAGGGAEFSGFPGEAKDPARRRPRLVTWLLHPDVMGSSTDGWIPLLQIHVLHIVDILHLVDP